MTSAPTTKNPTGGNISATSDELIIRAFARLDKLALGVAVGTIFGLAVFFATVFLILKGGSPVGPNLELLGQFFLGYRVTFTGSLVGLAYGSVCGFILGWLMAFLRNFLVDIYLHIVTFKANLLSYRDFMD